MTFCEVAAVERNNPKWTPELIELLKQLHEAGLSATLKARKINELHGTKFSRNSIIGATYRANLPKRESKVRTGTHARRAAIGARYLPAPRAAKPKQPKPFIPAPSIVDSEIPKEQRRTLLELTAHTCRFGVGDVGDASFFFCGAEPKDGSPYCAAHHQRCTYVRVR